MTDERLQQTGLERFELPDLRRESFDPSLFTTSCRLDVEDLHNELCRSMSVVPIQPILQLLALFSERQTLEPQLLSLSLQPPDGIIERHHGVR